MKGFFVIVFIIAISGLGFVFFSEPNRIEPIAPESETINPDTIKPFNKEIYDSSDIVRFTTSDNVTNKEHNDGGISFNRVKQSYEPHLASSENAQITNIISPEQVELDNWHESFRERLFQNINKVYESQPKELAKLLKYLDAKQSSINSPSLNPLLKPKYYQDFFTDSEWASQVESELRAFILSQSLDDNFNLIDIACKQLVCRLYYGGLSGQDLFKLTQAVSSYMESLYFIDFFGVRDYESRTGSTGFGMADRRMFQYQQISFESHHRR